MKVMKTEAGGAGVEAGDLTSSLVCIIQCLMSITC